MQSTRAHRKNNSIDVVYQLYRCIDVPVLACHWMGIIIIDGPWYVAAQKRSIVRGMMRGIVLVFLAMVHHRENVECTSATPTGGPPFSLSIAPYVVPST